VLNFYGCNKGFVLLPATTAMPAHVEIDPRNDVAVIPNTSASTGRPKGVCHSHFSMMVLNYDAKSLDILRYTFMTPMSNYAIGSYMASASSITNGSTIVHLGKFIKEQYLQQLTKYKVRVRDTNQICFIALLNKRKTGIFLLF
jgi:4-coumarate--CoA ligase